METGNVCTVALMFEVPNIIRIIIKTIERINHTLLATDTKNK